jgi:hypothetical protein
MMPSFSQNIQRQTVQLLVNNVLYITCNEAVEVKSEALPQYLTSRKFAGSISDGVTGIFH